MANHLIEAECRAEANRLLDDFLVGAPDEIDLDTIAWRTGQLRIENGKLDTAEGRLIASNKGGVIRVSDRVTNEGRRRFIIGHEIGHFVRHKKTCSFDTARDINTWSEGSPETEANTFAAELLMPERFFLPKVKYCEPSLAFLDRLAGEFRTSNQAAGIQFIRLTKEACAFIITIDGKIARMSKSRSFEFFVPFNTPHKYSAAGEILAGKSDDTRSMVATPAGAWLKGFDPDGREMIHEDSRFLRHYGMIVTLLWVKDDLERDGDE